MANVIITLVVLLSGLVFVVHAAVVDSCLVCTTSINEECRKPAAGAFISACAGDNPGCISRIVGDNIVRSCLNTLTVDEVTSCVSGICFPCDKNGCNNEPFEPVTPAPPKRLLCHRCSGNADSSCAGSTRIDGPSECPFYVDNDQCYIARPNGNYERGCLSTTKRCDSESCFKCSTDGCNSNDYNSANDIYSMTKMITFAILSVVIIMFNK